MLIALIYLATLMVFAVIDTLWLTTMAGPVYRPLIGEMLADKVRMTPALVFYALHAAGLAIFAVAPGVRADDWKVALMWGALFGLFTYGAYDLTNYATLKVWGLKITLIDMTWGVTVSAASAALASVAAARLGKLFGLAI
ncbi:MAG: DUF2177 family protein [Caulobacter sp.]|nr:DUF2177 family protein [Caulobacter sp.]